MPKGINESDVRDFKECAEKLQEVLSRIQVYHPGAYCLAEPGRLSLLDSNDFFVAGVDVAPLEIEH